MSIKMVRKPSDTPNINNIDDIIPFRYAYGNQDGAVKNKGTEISYRVNGNIFTILSGRLVLQGVESDIDANGVDITIDVATDTRYYIVYYEVNLANNTTNILLSDYSNVDYPIIDKGDDLTSNSSGIARLELFRFTIINGVISNVEKLVKSIDYTGTALIGYDIDKGTIEERLERLGFKEGSVIIASDSTTSKNSLMRQGNYVFGTVKFTERLQLFINQYRLIATLPEDFKLKIGTGFQIVSGDVRADIYSTASTGYSIESDGYINSNGEIYLRCSAERLSGIASTTEPSVQTIMIAYEAEPL